VLVLHEIEEMTAPEIAEILGIPLNTVYSRLRIARIELEQALAPIGGAR
jgi:RNA polymerase sigma-70 factor (ECF subfamily)